MEPQGAQRNFVEQTDQIIAPSRVGQFVKQDSVELSLIQYAIDAEREDRYGERGCR